MKKTIIAIMIQVLCVAAVSAQGKEIALLHFNHGDSVSLRWLPTSEAAFIRSATEGYIVQRKKASETSWQNISPTLHPLSNAEMERIEASDMNIYPLREILYGNGRKEYAAESGEKSSAADFAMLFAMASYGADLSLATARAGALLFTDKNIDRSAIYDYRVVFNSDASEAYANVYPIRVDMSKRSELPRIDDLSADFEEDYVHFQWGTASHKGYYSAYVVERSSDGVHFSPVKSRPFVPFYTDEKMKNIAIFRDTFPDKEATYHYRVMGYSPFGFYGPLSKAVTGQPKFNFKKIRLAVDTIIRKSKYTEVRWSVDKAYQRRIKGLHVMYTRDFKEFKALNKTLLPASAKSFKDYLSPLMSGYYAVVAYGYNTGETTDANYAYSHVPDDVPPAAPIGLKAVVDSAGVVSISWSRNSEPDIFAYRVYCSNTGREDDYFTIRGSYIKDTFVADTLPLNTLDKFKFYKVTAIDRSYNESDFSPAVRATKPDTIPPTAAAFRLPRQEKGEVIVEWSVARTPDATELLLFRQIGDTGKVELVKRYDLQKKEWPSSYHDSHSYSGEIVQYFITIKDEAGNEAKSASARLATEGKRKGCLKELKHLVVCDEKERKITLHWQHDEDNLTRIVVYRKKDDGRTLPIASVRASDTTYEDKEVAIGSTFTYVIRAVSSERVCPAIYSDPITFDGLVK